MSEEEQVIFIDGFRNGVIWAAQLMASYFDNLFVQMGEDSKIFMSASDIAFYLRSGLERFPNNKTYPVVILIAILDELQQDKTLKRQ